MIGYTLLAFVLGAIGWSFSEYALHNWWGHIAKGRNEFSREHLQHHAEKDYFTATPKKLMTAIPSVSAVGAISCLVAGLSYGLAFTLGFVITYVSYEVFHYQMHVSSPKTWVGHWLRRHHFAHHFNCPKMNHGVSSPIWDVVFRTYRSAPVVRVPARHAMRWLIDDQGEVLPEFADQYVVKTRKRLRSAPHDAT
jgi:sterol desaturase/sphingolipid hydroxylase (fatty acid hydroxylase superfamily)